MIVTSVESGWEVVFQRSHGLLAGQIAERFRSEFKPELWVETLDAILSHDDHKQAFDGRHYVTDLGAPKDFTLVAFDAEERIEEAKRRLRESTRNHRWIGLLISRHVHQLYATADGVQAEMIELLDEQTAWRRKTLREVGRKKTELEDAYQLLRWCDRCSLILARGNVPAMERSIEITHGLGGQRYELMQRQDGSIAVEPWPFEPDEFEVGVEVKCLNQLAFDDDNDLVTHLDEAKIDHRSWRLSKS